MNKTIVSREVILEAAKKISYQDGLEKLNIRDTASICNISIGTVYNYFPSKADLVVAVIQDFWAKAFHGQLMIQENKSFIDVYKHVYKILFHNLSLFKAGLLQQISLLDDIEKCKGKKTENEYLAHIHNFLLECLSNDANVDNSIWKEHFTKEKFIDFTMSIMLNNVKSGKQDCEFLLIVITKILYKT